MKKIFIMSVIGLMSLPVFAQMTTTTTRSYDEEVTSPSSNADMIQAEEEGYEDSTLDSEDVDQERMEERNYREHKTYENQNKDNIDYNDRTRTNRERKALNTGGNASDDR